MRTWVKVKSWHIIKGGSTSDGREVHKTYCGRESSGETVEGQEPPDRDNTCESCYRNEPSGPA